MFGLYRTILALSVVLLHLYGLPRVGNYAVHSFFVLSGFLMTTIMNDQYGFSASGRIRFILNRFLRLYPMYYYALGVSLILIVMLPNGYWQDYERHIYLPGNAIEWLQNLSLIFPNIIPHRIYPILLPATWALTVELFYYLLICFGLSRNRNYVLLWIAVSCIYVGYTYFFSRIENFRYSAIPAGSLPFALGSLVYFYKESIYKVCKKLILSPASMLLILVLNPILTQMLIDSSIVKDISFYANLLFSVFMTAILYKEGFNGVSTKFDNRIGEYSYPIYILHFQIGGLVSYLLYQKPVARLPIHTLAIVLPMLWLFCYAGILVLDRRISVIRKHLREN